MWQWEDPGARLEQQDFKQANVILEMISDQIMPQSYLEKNMTDGETEKVTGGKKVFEMFADQHISGWK